MKNYGIPVASEGWIFILPLVIVTVLFFILGWRYPGYTVLALTIFVLFFFRDPERVVPQGNNLVVSPADGRVVVVKDIFEPTYLKQDVKQISIFLSVFNVHVNRAPIGGKVDTVKYNPGKFHVASVDKASLDNEQTAMVITQGGRKVLVKQIAGLIARRIICYAKPGDSLAQGERYGLIRFGSRVDIFLPKDAEIKVKVGDRVKGARDVIGVLK
ncbi:MAG: phosphatidylserine decarboxylase [Nitrospirae bacterium GWC2_57_13]|nr:MAG: phosphatidylserine decarboxylase [Nitrospirae bacterium GWC2_57_13]OGW46637.1 MAG: phosphatidylserine decarboxylase [Nitrospirae bacterium GWD2_57_8]HAS54818.1 phosphatidylserine decarboxylase family protein [Nitrospiraceae bacterium]